MKITTVTSLEEPALYAYRTLRRPQEHQRRGIFVAEGLKVVHRLFESDLKVVSCLMTREWFETYETQLAKRNPPPQVFVAEKRLLEQIVGFHLHQGIMAVGKIPEQPRLEAVIQRTRRPILLVALDGLTNAENLGVLVRNCVAFGAHGLLVGETSSSPYLRRAVRNSMGTVFKIPVLHPHNLAGSLQELRTRHGIRCFAAHPRSDKSISDERDFARDCCVVFGSEGEGISQAVLDACDGSLAIPMEAGIDSLNVASASAVVLYEVQRRRNSRG